MVETQINIAFIRSIISHFAKNKTSDHFSIVNQVLRYLANNPEKRIIFEIESKLNFVGYSEFD